MALELREASPGGVAVLRVGLDDPPEVDLPDPVGGEPFHRTRQGRVRGEEGAPFRAAADRAQAQYYNRDLKFCAEGTEQGFNPRRPECNPGKRAVALRVWA